MQAERYPACRDCNEPESGSFPDGRCRDCELDYMVAQGACRECFRAIWREDVAGPYAKQHRDGCSLATAEDWTARDDAELARVREARGRG